MADMLEDNKTPRFTFTPKTMAILALLAAVSFILERFLGINSGFFKLHFGYLPIAMAGMLYGLIPGIAVAVVADIISNLGAGFSLVFVGLAALEGAVYALILHPVRTGKKALLLQAVLAQLAVSLIVHAGLNTLALWMLYRVFTPMRFLLNLITYPIKVFTLYKLLEYRPVFERYAKT